jgi:hypothetical protein
VLLGTLTPLLYYGRLLAIGLEGARTQHRVAWRPVVGRLDRNDLRGWVLRTWNDNRLITAAGGAIALAVLALVVSAGAFGTPGAAAGLPPTVGASVESFTPAEPVPEVSGTPSPTGSEAPPEQPTAAPNAAPTEAPSFEPVPTST